MRKEVVCEELFELGSERYGTVVSLVKAASQKAQQVHNQEAQKVKSEELIGEKMGSFVKKTKTWLVISTGFGVIVVPEIQPLKELR